MAQRYSRRTVVVSLAAAAGAVASTRLLDVAAQTPAASPAASPAPIAHPAGADDLVLRVEISGGLIPPGYLITELPAFSLYGDGRLIFLGPQIEIYPPPALPNLRTVRLTETGMQTVLHEAQRAGLLDGDRDYRNSVARDAPTSFFTVNAGHKSILVTAYALGIGNDPDWTEQEWGARQKLFDFAQRLAGLPQSLPSATIAEPEDAYQITRLQIVAEPTTAAPPPGTPIIGARATPIPQPPMDWPLSTPLASAGAPYTGPGSLTDARCTEISGDEAKALLTALQSANALTPWISDGAAYRVLVRPLLPDESACRPMLPGTPVAPVASPAS